jgi:hypothetical protein
MRFFVPNREIVEEKEKDEAMEDEGDSEEEVTPAKIFNDQILKRAGLGE